MSTSAQSARVVAPLEALVIALKGFCMGAADVVPGVSGGTMAFILGIYERLLRAIRAFDIGLLRLLVKPDLPAAVRHTDLCFLLALAAGIACALFVFTRVVPLPVLIQTDPVPVFSLFFGLVAASIVVLLRHIGRFDVTGGVLIALGAALGLLIVNLVPMETPDAGWFLFLSGAVAITAMILPGISGSFVLLMLRKYAYVFDAIGRLDFTVLIPFALGAVCGLILFTRVLVWLIGRFRTGTLLMITGLLIGSLWLIWPFQLRVFETIRGKERLVSATPIAPWDSGESLGWAIAWMTVGLAVVFAVERLSGARASRLRRP